MKEQIKKIIKAEMTRHNEATLYEAYAREIEWIKTADEYHEVANACYRFVKELESVIGESHLMEEITEEYRGYQVKHMIIKEW